MPPTTGTRRTRTVRNVLSIDGCGFRGRTQLLVLKKLMELHSGDADNPSRPCDVFDLICGTAAGGLIAILLGRLGMTCKDAIDAYDDLESTIFSATPTIKAILALHGQIDTGPFQERLEEIIKDYAGNEDAPMNEVGGQPTRQCRTLVTVMNQAAVVDNDAQRVRSYASPPHLGDTNDPEIIPGHVWTILQAAIGTTSCPALFSPFTLEGHGFMAANTSGFSNPSMIAYLEALDLFGENADLTLISLGMGLRTRHDYSSLSTKAAKDMITSLGISPTDSSMENLISHTQLVATSTQIRHLRLDRLLHRQRKHEYMRLDPDRRKNPFVFVDYTQKDLIEIAVDDFFKGYQEFFDFAVDYVRRLDSAWVVLRGYTSDSGTIAQRLAKTPEEVNKMTSREIMRECVLWEEEAIHSGEHISCFAMKNTKTPTQSVRVITGDFHPDDDDDSTLYVRVLLDDEWRFFPQYRAPEGGNWRIDVGGSIRNPVEAILEARKNTAIKAFRSDGWYTTSDVAPEKVNIHELSFSLPYYGTWVRTTS